MDKKVINEFKCYKVWCKWTNHIPSHPDSLKAYLKYIKE